MVLEVTAREDDVTLFEATRTWFEIGLDANGDMRFGAWEIKEIIDASLQPLETRRLSYLMHFQPETRNVAIEARLWYYRSAKQGQVVHEETRAVAFGAE